MALAWPAEAQSGAEAPPTINARLDLARCLFALRDFEKAETLYRTCLDSYSKTEPDAPKTYAIQGRLGQCYVELCRWEEAEPLLLEAWEKLDTQREKLPQKQKAVLDEIASGLRKLYAESGQPEKAEGWNSLQRTQPPKKPISTGN